MTYLITCLINVIIYQVDTLASSSLMSGDVISYAVLTL